MPFDPSGMPSLEQFLQYLSQIDAANKEAQARRGRETGLGSVITTSPETQPLPQQQPRYGTEDQVRRAWGNDPSNPFPEHVFRK
jgi:hypothetical protein